MKLLDRSVRSSLLFSSLTLLISIPAIYFAVVQIIEEDAQESLYSLQAQFVIQHQKNIRQYAAQPGFNPNVTLRPGTPKDRDTLYRVSSYDSLSNENIPYLVLERTFEAGGSYFRLTLKNSLVDQDDLIISIMSIVIGTLLLIVAGLLVINRILSRRLWRPFFTTIDRLNKFRIDQLTQFQFEKTDIDEFNHLNKSIAEMTGKDQKTFQAQKEFTENASHELQTPLAIISGNLDLLMSTEPLSETQIELLTSMHNSVGRINKLNRALILLARIDNEQYHVCEDCDAGYLTSNVAEQYREWATQRKIVITGIIPASIIIRANADLFEILLGNLMSNAVRHNYESGRINIELNHRSLTVSNSGQQDPLQKDLLFRRFKKMGTSSDSPGLGLAIIQRIVEVNNFEAEYKYSEGFHQFIISF